MKYIYYIIGILLIFSIAVAVMQYRNYSSDNKDLSEVALKINGRIYTNEEFNILLKDKPHDLTNLQYTKTLIDKELLIQEAMRLKLHENQDFKTAIKNYYEQSLISALMNNKSEEMIPVASETEINKFISKLSSKVNISTFFYKDFENALSDSLRTEEKTATIDFADLSDNLKYHISYIEPGQKTPPLADESGYKVIRLNKIDNSAPEIPLNEPMRAMAAKIITSSKKKYLMETWQQELKNKADIEIKELKK